MDKNVETDALRKAHQDKLKELQAHQQNLKALEAELKRMNAKLQKHEPLSVEDTKFMGNLGWLTALSVTIASVAATLQ